MSIPRLSIFTSSTDRAGWRSPADLVKDEFDRTRRVIWWRGAGWPLPEGIFDLACVVRASNFRGQRDVQVEWLDARPVEAGEIHLRSVIPVIDQRDNQHPLPVLQAILGENGPDNPVVVWAEAEARKTKRPRPAQLAPAATLIVWTTPPGRGELEAAVTQVKPHNIVVFAVDPLDTTPDAFLKRLAGLVRYAQEKLGGKVEFNRLTAATAQREATVRLGLQWLEQKGLVKVAWPERVWWSLCPEQIQMLSRRLRPWLDQEPIGRDRGLPSVFPSRRRKRICYNGGENQKLVLPWLQWDGTQRRPTATTAKPKEPSKIPVKFMA